MPSRRRRPALPGFGPLGRAVVLLALGIAVAAFAVARSEEPGAEPVSAAVPAATKVLEPTGDAAREGRPAAPATNRAQDARSRLWPAEGHRLAAVRSSRRVELRERPGGKLVERVGPRTEFGSPRVFSVLARRGSWLRVATEVSADNTPLWVRADPARLRFETTDISIHANLTERLVELHSGDRVRHRLEVTIGAPGSSTPTGRFAVTDTFVGRLNPVYGCCAIALTAHQPDLPSDWIGGDRVIHGTTGPVGSAASNGCLRAENADMRVLIPATPPGAPVFISR